MQSQGLLGSKVWGFDSFGFFFRRGVFLHVLYELDGSIPLMCVWTVWCRSEVMFFCNSNRMKALK